MPTWLQTIPFSALASAVASVVANVLLVYKLVTSRLEVKKLQQEVQALKANRQKNLHEYDDMYAAADRCFRECSKTYFDVLTAPTRASLNDAREKLCGAINDLLERQRNRLEFYCCACQDDPKKCQTLIDNTVHELRQCKRYLHAANNRTVLECLNKVPLIITKHTMVRTRDAATLLPVSQTMKDILNTEIDALVTAYCHAT
jgi:hypothetical protein